MVLSISSCTQFLVPLAHQSSLTGCCFSVKKRMILIQYLLNNDLLNYVHPCGSSSTSWMGDHGQPIAAVPTAQLTVLLSDSDKS